LILVTGATGKVGTALVRRLVEAGEEVRVFVRDPGKATMFDGKVDVAKGDLDDPESVRKALEQADKAFMLTMSPQHEADFISAALDAGIRHLVMLSSGGVPFGVASGPIHAPGESLLKDSSLGWTILRPWEFMSNSLWWAEPIRSQASVFEPTGEGKTGLIDPEDIAAVAAKVLASDGHEGKTYELTGPELLSRSDMVDKISTAIGKRVSFVNIPAEAYRNQMAQMGVPEFILEPAVAYQQMVSEGKLAILYPDVENILGRAPGSYEHWLSSNAAAFK